MKILLLFLGLIISIPASFYGQTTHKIAYSFSPERTIFNKDTIYVSRVFPADLPGIQTLDSIAVNYGTFDTVSQEGGLLLEARYASNKVENELVFNVELFYRLYQHDFYAKSVFPYKNQKNQSFKSLIKCSDSKRIVKENHNGTETFRQNLQRLLDSLSLPEARQSLYSLYGADGGQVGIRDELLEKAQILAEKEGLQVRQVEGFKFESSYFDPYKWLLLDDPDLGLVTIDPYAVWQYPSYCTIENLLGYYVITESCFNDPFKGKWFAQVNRKKRGINPISRSVKGIDYLQLVFRDAQNYYNSFKLDESIHLLDILIGLDPSNTSARCFYAMLDARQGRFDKAESIFNIFIEHDYLPDNQKTGAYYAYGNFLALQGKREESIFYIQKAFTINPDFASFVNVLKDEDLKNLRNFPPFIKLVKQLEEQQSRKD